MVERLYQKWGISDDTDFSRLRPTDYPILSDLYELIEDAYQNYESYGPYQLYTPEILRGLLLGLHSMCKGADARFFNGHTNSKSLEADTKSENEPQGTIKFFVGKLENNIP